MLIIRLGRLKSRDQQVLRSILLSVNSSFSSERQDNLGLAYPIHAPPSVVNAVVYRDLGFSFFSPLFYSVFPILYLFVIWNDVLECPREVSFTHLRWDSIGWRVPSTWDGCDVRGTFARRLAGLLVDHGDGRVAL